MISKKINTGKLGGKIRIRILRPWRGYPVGVVINPPGALRQILMQTKDQLGHPVAEIVEDENVEIIEHVEDQEFDQEIPKKRGRPGKK